MNPTHLSANQRTKSTKSCYRSIPGQRDEGQRYVVTYLDGMGQRKRYGFTNDIEGARKWIAAIKKNPMWSKPRIGDRAPA